MRSTMNCPVSIVKIDENTIRVASFITIIFLFTGILLKSYLLLFLLAFDFGLRALTTGKYSFIKILSKYISANLGLSQKQIDSAPKKFAAGLGMVFSILIGIFLFSGNLLVAYSFGFLLGVCAFLEGAFGLCVGCHIYSWIVVPFYKPQQIKN